MKIVTKIIKKGEKAFLATNLHEGKRNKNRHKFNLMSLIQQTILTIFILFCILNPGGTITWLRQYRLKLRSTEQFSAGQEIVLVSPRKEQPKGSMLPLIFIKNGNQGKMSPPCPG